MQDEWHQGVNHHSGASSLIAVGSHTQQSQSIHVRTP